MKTLSAFAVILTLYTAVCWGTQALEKANIVCELAITERNSATIALNEYLLTVSKNRSHVHINSTYVHYKECTIATDPFEDIIQGKIKVEAAAYDEIFIWGVQSREVDKNITSTYYAILSVNPWACTYKSISIPKSDDAAMSKNFLPRLVKYSNDRRREGFDVFFPSLKTCTPCHVSDQGNVQFYPLRFNFKANLTENESQFRFFIRWMAPHYFYIHNLSNNSSLVKYLSSDDIELFNTIKEKYLDYAVDAVAVKKGKVRSVGICSKRNLNQHWPFVYDEIRCEKFNSKLQSVVSIIIPTPEKEVSSISLTFDDQGNSFISFAENNELRVYIYDVDGQLLQSFNLGNVDERFRSFSTNLSNSKYSYWDTNGFLVGEQYCIIVEQMKTEVYAQSLHVVKCISVAKYINKSKF